jgi:hypothetical protein
LIEMVSWPDISLKEVLKDPILLQSFEKFLIDNWSQENLLFIEAIYQLKHIDNDPQEIRFALTRYDQLIDRYKNKLLIHYYNYRY